MAIAFENGGAPTPQAGFPGSTTFTFDITVDADATFLRVNVAWAHTTALSVSGVTAEGNAMTEVTGSEITLDTGANGYGIKGVCQFGLENPPTGAGVTIVITMSGNCREYVPTWDSWSGNFDGSFFGDVQTGSAVDTGSTSAALSALTLEAGEVSLGGICSAADAATAVTPGDTQSGEAFTDAQFGSCGNGSYQTADGNLNWTVPNTNTYGWAASGFALREASAGGGGASARGRFLPSLGVA